MAWRYCYKDVLPFSAMVAAESTSVGLNTLFKAATLKGLSYYVFILYSYAIATLLLLPLALIFRRYVYIYLLISFSICIYIFNDQNIDKKLIDTYADQGFLHLSCLSSIEFCYLECLGTKILHKI